MLFKKDELIEKVAKQFGVTKVKAGEMLTFVFNEIYTEMDNGKDFRFPVFGGTMKKVTVPARTARNPKTGEEVSVPEKWKFKYTFKAQEAGK